MPNICQIYQLLHVQISDNYINKFTSYELTEINYISKSTGMYNFTLLVYASEQICWTHCTYMSHCTSNVVGIQTLHSCKHPSQFNKLQHLFTILLQNMCQQQVFPSNAKQIPKFLNVHQWGSMPIYMPHMKSLALTMRPGALYTGDDNDTR